MHISCQCESERRRKGREELDLQPGVLTRIGKGVRGGFPKKRKRSCFLNGLNRARMKEEETVGEVVSEEKEAWKVFLK